MKPWLVLVMVLGGAGSGFAFRSAGAHAAPPSDRYAIVIGANRGEPDEVALRYAEQDARRIGEVLVDLGGVAAEDLLVMASPDVAAVTRALSNFKARIRTGTGATLFVYYSGHADAETLHLAGQRLPFRELKRLVAALGADATVFVMDACKSGGILRKGGTPTKAFDFVVQDEIATRGVAVITSSAENEDAQESDRLQGGVFTHHLVAGLIGAADTSGDARVSLAEAYRYAYEQTVITTSTSAIVQHPTYSFDVRGRDEIVMTDLSPARQRGVLRLVDAGLYVILRGASGRGVVAELNARRDTHITLDPGSYLVRRREPSAVFERVVIIAGGATTKLATDELERVAFRHAVRKGYDLTARRALSLGADVELSSALFGEGTMWLGAIGVQLDWADIAVRGRARFGYSEPATRLDVRQYLFGVDLGIYHLFDVADHGMGFGLRAGLDWLAQRFETTGLAPDVDQLVGRVAPVVRFELALGGVFALQLDLGVELYLLEVDDGDGARFDARVLPTGTLGVSVSL